MIEQIKVWDERLFLWLNQFHAPWMDPIMFMITKTELWIPLYAILIYLIFKNYKKEGWLILVGIVITLVMADMITYRFMKPYFLRLRPSHETSLESIIHIVNDYRGGLHGFASSHAANTTGVAFFIFLLFKNKYRWIWTIFVWAFAMSYSRIYLGVHYPGDILVGAVVGILCGYAGFEVYRLLKRWSKFRGKQENIL